MGVDVDLHMPIQDKNEFLGAALVLFFIGFAAFFDTHKGGHHFFVHDIFGQDFVRSFITVGEDVGIFIMAEVYNGVLMAQSFVKLGDIYPKSLGDLYVRLESTHHFFVLIYTVHMHLVVSIHLNYLTILT